MKLRTAIIPVLACAALVNVPLAAAQTYPTKPIRFIVPYAPGGGTDVMARIISPRLADAIGQQVIVDNRPGAGGNVGSEMGARAAPDGYTILMGAAALAINVSLYSKLNFDPLKDLAPVTLLGKSPNIVAVHPSLPVRSIKDLIALAKSRPGQLNYGSGGSGTTPHLAAELFKSMAHVDIVHVPYKSAGPAIIGVISGEVSMTLSPALAVLPHVESGRLRALAVTSTTRIATLPKLPTVAESGLPGFESAQWFGVFVPAATPSAVISKLNTALVKIMHAPDVNEQMTQQGSIAMSGSPAEFAAYMRAEVQKWAKVVKASGAHVE